MAATVKGEARETNLQLTSHNYQVFSLFFLKLGLSQRLQQAFVAPYARPSLYSFW